MPARRFLVLRSLRRSFLEADTRGLSVFRIAYGLVLLGYLVNRVSGDGFIAFHTNLGVYPNHYALFNPAMPNAWSLLHAFSTPLHVGIALALIGAGLLCFTIGYRTRFFTILSFASVVSLHHRMPLVVNGSMVMMHLLFVWTLFLPLGRHYSMDAWLRRRRGEPLAPELDERVTSLAVLGFRLQLIGIYFFNVVHKTGETWRDGSAVHYVLWQDRIVMWPALLVREHAPAWLSPAATYGTLILESAIAALLLLPVFTKQARRIAAFGMLVLHGGIGLLVNLGPFPFVFACAALLLLAADDWSRFDAWLKSRVRSRLAAVWKRFGAVGATRSEGPPRVPNESSTSDRIAVGLREAYFALMLVVAGVVMRNDNAFCREHLGPADPPRSIVWLAQTLFVPQGWGLFAPEAPRRDGTLVIDGVLADGTRVDPIRHASPTFDVLENGPRVVDYFWQTYMPKLAYSGNGDLWRFLLDYLERVPEIEGWAGERRFVYLAAYYVEGERPGMSGKPVPPPVVRLHAYRGTVPDDHALPPHVPRPAPSQQERALGATSPSEQR